MKNLKSLVVLVLVLVAAWYLLTGSGGAKKLALQSDDWQSVAIYELVPGMKTADFSNRTWFRLPVGFVEWCEANKVDIIFLSNNEFTSVPPELVRYSTLKMLSMRMNKLKQVDCNLLPKSLEHLVLTDNKISHFVGDCTFPRLKKLMLARNKLEQMDNVLMPKLELLRLSQNKFRTLPIALLKHSYSLKWASFGDNPCCVCPQKKLPVVVKDLDCSEGKQLGQGTSGVALLCNKGTLVVKQFKSLSSDGSAQSEIDVVAQLPSEHANILVPVGVTANNNELVFPYVNAKALGHPPTFGTEDTFPAGGHDKYSVQRVEDAVKQAACALRDIHRAQVSHGDLYAHNTVMSSSRFAFLDFGAGTCLGATSTQEERVLMYSLDSRAFSVLVQNMVDHVVNEDGVTTEYLETMGTKASLGVDAEFLCNLPVGRV